jgi:hypothetical protein
MKFTNHRYNYASLSTSWAVPGGPESFLVAYAVKGQIQDPSEGLRAGLPSLYPLEDSPVREPSPLNTRWQYIPQVLPSTHFPSGCGI